MTTEMTTSFASAASPGGTAARSVVQHWPEYLLEAAGLGLFMISACLVTVLLEYPSSPVRQALPDPWVRRLLIGIAMGLTAISLIYSPLGKRSGAHLNPAVTLTFLRLGKIEPWDAVLLSSQARRSACCCRPRCSARCALPTAP